MNQTAAKVVYVAGVTTFCTFLGCWAVLAHQENTPTTHSATKTRARVANPPYGDEKFVREAAEGNISEVKMGQLAEQKAQSEEVKKFAKRMIEDHSKATDELKQIAVRENINMPTNVNRKEADTYRSLEKLSGPAFDRAYARNMVTAHEKDITEFKQQASSGQKGAVKEFAQRTLPTLESHLQEAKQMMASVQHEVGHKRERSGAGGSARR